MYKFENAKETYPLPKLCVTYLNFEGFSVSGFKFTEAIFILPNKNAASQGFCEQ